MKDWQKWALAIGIGALGGFVDASTDKFPGWWDLTRHMAIGVSSVLVPLKMTIGGK